MRSLPATRFALFPVCGWVLVRYDHTAECMYSRTEVLNFAIHVRLGDRARALTKVRDGYFEVLEAFMDTVTSVVVLRGYLPPVFHIFSETSLPCPNTYNGTFDEFPDWPVDMDQVRKGLKLVFIDRVNIDTRAGTTTSGRHKNPPRFRLWYFRWNCSVS